MSFLKNLLKLFYQRRPFLSADGAEVVFAPSHRRQPCCSLQSEGGPHGFTTFERQEKLTVGIGHRSDDFSHYGFSCGQEVLNANGLSRLFRRGLLIALRHVSEAYGMADVAKAAGIEREIRKETLPATIRRRVAHVDPQADDGTGEKQPERTSQGNFGCFLGRNRPQHSANPPVAPAPSPQALSGNRKTGNLLS